MQSSNQIGTGFQQENYRMTDQFILYHELDGKGTVIRSVALDDGVFELLSILIAVTVFVGIIRWVMGGEKQ